MPRYPIIDIRLASRFAVLICATLAAATGCSLWPFQKPVKTSFVTPAKRMAAIETLGEQASAATTEQQTHSADELARIIQTEDDPLVRESIVETIAKLQVPMASQVLMAGLNDADPHVRRKCCRLLGARRELGAIPALEETLRMDGDTEVRVAATRALGTLGVKESIPAIAIALHDRDPALQYVGVEAMKLASGEDIGNDVGAWRQLAARYAPADDAAIAERPTPGTQF